MAMVKTLKSRVQKRTTQIDFVDDTVATLGFYIQSMGATDFPVLDAHCLVIVFHNDWINIQILEMI